jgi:hypothetical protein
MRLNQNLLHTKTLHKELALRNPKQCRIENKDSMHFQHLFPYHHHRLDRHRQALNYQNKKTLSNHPRFSPK